MVGTHHQPGLRPVLPEISRRSHQTPAPVNLTSAQVPFEAAFFDA
jgi:hypothetical protein